MPPRLLQDGHAGLLGQLLGVRGGRGLDRVCLRERGVVLARGHVPPLRGALVEVYDRVRMLRRRVVRCACRPIAFRLLAGQSDFRLFHFRMIYFLDEYKPSCMLLGDQYID